MHTRLAALTITLVGLALLGFTQTGIASADEGRAEVTFTDVHQYRCLSWAPELCFQIDGTDLSVRTPAGVDMYSFRRSREHFNTSSGELIYRGGSVSFFMWKSGGFFMRGENARTNYTDGCLLRATARWVDSEPIVDLRWNKHCPW